MKVKVGSVLNAFQIERANGTIDHFDKPIHNFMNNLYLKSEQLFSAFSGTSYCWTSPHGWVMPSYAEPRKKMLTGVYEQVGTVINRISGEDLPGNCAYVWESTGQWVNAYNGAASFRDVTKSLTVAAGSSNLWVFRTDYPGNTSVTNAWFTTNTNTSSTRVGSYASGVFTIKNTNIIRSSIFSSTWTTNALGLTGPNNQNVNWFPLAADLTINAGDRLLIGKNDFVSTWTLDEYAPRALPVCPLTGITTSCVVQRLLPFLIDSSIYSNDTQLATRIWLISDANKMTIPSDMGAIVNIIAPASITPMETIVSTGTVTLPTVENEHLRGNQGVGTVVTGGTVKQIAWGNTVQLFGVIEFDTPQVISAGQVITIGGRTRVTQDYII